MVDALNGGSAATSRSRYRELPGGKAGERAWADYYRAIFKDCLKLQRAAASPEYTQCREEAARKLVAAGTGNGLLKLDKAVALSWVAFFDLPACLLVQMPGKCGGVACDKLLGWTADRCFT